MGVTVKKKYKREKTANNTQHIVLYVYYISVETKN